MACPGKGPAFNALYSLDVRSPSGHQHSTQLIHACYAVCVAHSGSTAQHSSVLEVVVDDDGVCCQQLLVRATCQSAQGDPWSPAYEGGDNCQLRSIASSTAARISCMRALASGAATISPAAHAQGIQILDRFTHDQMVPCLDIKNQQATDVTLLIQEVHT